MDVQYMYEEALEFVTKNISMFPVAACIMSDLEEEEENVSEVMVGNSRDQDWDKAALVELHSHVIQNCRVTEDQFRSVCLFDVVCVL